MSTFHIVDGVSGDILFTFNNEDDAITHLVELENNYVCNTDELQVMSSEEHRRSSEPESYIYCHASDYDDQYVWF